MPREGPLKVDLPTRAVQAPDDGQDAVERLVIEVLGHATDATLVGYVRNVVDVPDAGSPLRDRHWRPLVQAMGA